MQQNNISYLKLIFESNTGVFIGGSIWFKLPAYNLKKCLTAVFAICKIIFDNYAGSLLLQV